MESSHGIPHHGEHPVLHPKLSVDSEANCDTAFPSHDSFRGSDDAYVMEPTFYYATVRASLRFTAGFVFNTPMKARTHFSGKVFSRAGARSCGGHFSKFPGLTVFFGRSKSAAFYAGWPVQGVAGFCSRSVRRFCRFGFFSPVSLAVAAWRPVGLGGLPVLLGNRPDSLGGFPAVAGDRPDGLETFPDVPGNLPDRLETRPDELESLPDGLGTVPDELETLKKGPNPCFSGRVAFFDHANSQSRFPRWNSSRCEESRRAERRAGMDECSALVSQGRPLCAGWFGRSATQPTSSALLLRCCHEKIRLA
jgi:hypothetical protein